MLPFVHDDYPRALAEAKQKNKPLFVDAWATWCHSCQSLRTYVLTDPSLAPLAGDFVWLSVDTEKDVNAEWVAKHPHSALPTLWVVDPKTDRPILKWAGTATASELRELLTVALADARGAGSPAMEATAAFVRGNQALAEGDTAGAEREHRAAIAAAPKGHPHRARMVEALVNELSLGKKEAACAEVAGAEAASLASGTSRAAVVALGLECARDAKMARETALLFELALRDARDASSPLLPDDRSALYEEAVETKVASGDETSAKALALEWATFLEREAARARTKDARTSLDPLRLNAYLALHEPARAIPMLDESERDFPEDFNPPARLAKVYVELGRLPEADAAVERALARVYGPRIMRVLAVKADVAKARGDRAGEKKALEQALAKTEGATLTEGQRSVRDDLAARLKALQKP